MSTSTHCPSPANKSLFARLFALALLAVLALSLVLPAVAQGAPKRFGKDQAENIALFLAEDGWDEAMADACQTFMKDGLLASYILAQQYVKDLKGKELSSTRVEDMQKAFALASFIFVDRIYTQEALTGATGAERARLNAILKSHDSSAQTIVDPTDVHNLVSERLGLAKEQEEQLSTRMYALFNKTFREVMAREAAKNAAQDGEDEPAAADDPDSPGDQDGKDGKNSSDGSDGSDEESPID